MNGCNLHMLCFFLLSRLCLLPFWRIKDVYITLENSFLPSDVPPPPDHVQNLNATEADISCLLKRFSSDVTRALNALGVPLMMRYANIHINIVDIDADLCCVIIGMITPRYLRKYVSSIAFSPAVTLPLPFLVQILIPMRNLCSISVSNSCAIYSHLRDRVAVYSVFLSLACLWATRICL